MTIRNIIIKNLTYTIRLLAVLSFFFMLVSFSGCKNIAANEAQIKEQQDIIKEEETAPEEEEAAEEEKEDAAPDEENTEEEVKSELFLILNNFFQTVKEGNHDKEYEFFDSYTRGMVGSLEEYKNGKDGTIYIIEESHSSWKNTEAESLILEGNRAILTIIGDRNAEGIESTGEEIGFKFINEEGIWKIDAYYQLDIQIIPLSPEPDIVINSAEITTLTISANIRSFFSISDIRLQLNDAELNPDISGEDKYEREISVEIPTGNLIIGLNKTICYVADVIERETDYNWSFTVR